MTPPPSVWNELLSFWVLCVHIFCILSIISYSHVLSCLGFLVGHSRFSASSSLHFSCFPHHTLSFCLLLIERPSRFPPYLPPTCETTSYSCSHLLGIFYSTYWWHWVLYCVLHDLLVDHLHQGKCAQSARTFYWNLWGLYTHQPHSNQGVNIPLHILL